MKIEAVLGDITQIKSDAIVNSCNTKMRLGGKHSVSGAINRITRGRVQKAFAHAIYPKIQPFDLNHL